MMATIRKLFWIALYVVSTLSFVVLFENGTTNFKENFGKELKGFKEGAMEQMKPLPKKSPTPVPERIRSR